MLVGRGSDPAHPLAPPCPLRPCNGQVYAAAMRAAEAAGEPTPPMSVGFTYELCAGIVDKPGLPLTKIMQEEVGGWQVVFGFLPAMHKV